ncbi:hypothetical protein C6P61_06345 [Malikia spinosa]|uniref:Uncharacterized protein n=1 Tax=Malikia spinosa TaxID=86180 RepID=A0A2S9KFM3_9BURK|nr:hypothetical protein [Malikia spinosa]PRD69260.1 hypothetical protein C6P61_06345 [Malikia spinosa]
MTPTQKKLLAELVTLRHAARGWVRVNRLVRDNIKRFEVNRDLALACGDSEVEQDSRGLIQESRERLTEYRFYLVEVGQHFNRLSREINEHLPREAWLEALSVNRAEWETESMRQHGGTPMNVVAVLRLENSATRDDDIATRPLAWCCQMALMNAMQTSDKLDRAIHEASNEFFGGAFGEYRERSPLERMGIPASMIQGGEG